MLTALVALFVVSCATPPRYAGPGYLQTCLGALPADRVGVVLPHEHIFTDLRGPDRPGYGEADAGDVVRTMKPLLAEARAQGVSVLVECSTVGVGRNPSVIARLARETGLAILLPTGVYGRAHFAPQRFRQMSERELEKWMIGEIRDGIDETEIRAGFIKTAASEKSLQPLEEKFLRASARAARQTGVAIASHTTSGPVAVRQVDILAQESLPADQFIWVHAQAEPDQTYHRQLAARGAYIEFDSIGADPAEDPSHIARIQALIAAGHARRILLSHDAGWYNPGQPNGGTQRTYTYLLAHFVPKLRQAGLGEEIIRQLTIENPLRAFAVRY